MILFGFCFKLIRVILTNENDECLESEMIDRVNTHLADFTSMNFETVAQTIREKDEINWNSQEKIF